MTARQRHAIRETHLDNCRAQAIQLMHRQSLGQQAIEDSYYTEMFGWFCN